MHKAQRLSKKWIKSILARMLALSLMFVAVIFSTPTLANATPASVAGCNMINADDFGCNIIRVADLSGNGASDIYYYGTYGFYNPMNGQFEESFCIEMGVGAPNAVDGINNGEIYYTGSSGVGANMIAVPDYGIGQVSGNARYAVGWLMNQYYSNALDAYATDILYEGVLINQSAGSSGNHVKVAVAVSYLIHAWFEVKNPSYSGLLQGYLASLPTSYRILIDRLLSVVPSISGLLPQLTTAYVAYENNSPVLIVGFETGSFYIKESIYYENRGNYIRVPNYNGMTINFCNSVQYPIVYSIAHTLQDSVTISSDLTSREMCSAASAVDYFNLASFESQMLQQRYVTSNVIDRLSYSYSNWPCSASEIAPNGSCAGYATLNATIRLYKRTNLTDSPGSAYSARTITLTRQSETNGVVDVNFGSLPPAFYTAQVELSWPKGQILHPSDLTITASTPATAAVLRESVSTYNCQLTHSSHASNYSILSNEGIWDELNINGRCNYGTVNAGTFAAKTTAEVMLVGPLSSVPVKNLPHQQPQYNCVRGGSTCIFAQKTVELKNGGLRYGSFTEPLRPTDSGLYVFVYHYAGDVFTPEFYSDASDGEEMFYVTTTGSSVQMWSKADPRAEIGSNFRDTVYIAGNVRAGAYIVFDAYRAEAPQGIAQCTQKLYDGYSERQLVGSTGGKYLSPAVSSLELGNVYWIATLYEADGTIYRNYSDTGTTQVQGICGEKEETTEVFWNVELSSSATKSAVLGEIIKDVAHVNSGTTLPTQLTIEFNCYKDTQYLVPTNLVYSWSQPLNSLGDIESNDFVPETVGRYYWIITIYDQFHNVVAQGEYGDPNETSHVFTITSAVSTHYIQSGQTIFDTYYLSGEVPVGAVLVPELWYNCSEVDISCTAPPQLVTDFKFAPLELGQGIQEYHTTAVALHNVGMYFFAYTVYTDTTLSQVLHTDQVAYESESFQVIDLTTHTLTTAYIGQPFSDSVILLGKYPETTCVYWEMYYIVNQAELWKDKLVDKTSCRKLDLSDPSIGTSNNPIHSDEVTQLILGKYYWVAYLSDTKTGQLLSKGEIRDPLETIEILNLNGTVITESETATSAYIGERFNDTVTLTGRIPEDGWIIWDVYLQDISSANPLDDELILTTEPKSLKDGQYFDDDQLFRITSDPITLTSPGKYYWVERIYSPLQEAPVGIGSHRLSSETVEIKPHTGIISTMSKAVDFVRVGEDFYDIVYLTCNIVSSTKQVIGDHKTSNWQNKSNICWELLDGGSIKWQIFRKNLHSDDAKVDELVYETDDIALADGEINSYGELEFRSKTINFQVPGVYYWVESISSPLQDELVTKQDSRMVQETTIVEENSGMYVRIGKKNGVTELNLATTGITLGKIVGTAAVVAVLAKFSRQVSINTRRRKKWNRKTNLQRNVGHRIKRTWWWHSYRLH